MIVQGFPSFRDLHLCSSIKDLDTGATPRCRKEWGLMDLDGDSTPTGLWQNGRGTKGKDVRFHVSDKDVQLQSSSLTSTQPPSPLDQALGQVSTSSWNSLPSLPDLPATKPEVDFMEESPVQTPTGGSAGNMQRVSTTKAKCLRVDFGVEQVEDLPSLPPEYQDSFSSCMEDDAKSISTPTVVSRSDQRVSTFTFADNDEVFEFRKSLSTFTGTPTETERGISSMTMEQCSEAGAMTEYSSFSNPVGFFWHRTLSVGSEEVSPSEGDVDPKVVAFKDLHRATAEPQIPECIRFVRANYFKKLPIPVPRCQDLPEKAFGIPRRGDILVSVSHGWRNQSHPDPNGRKHHIMTSFFEKLCDQFGETHVFIFFDFLSISQRAFRPGQEGRSEAEHQQFVMALSHMHKMYFLADYVLHLEFDEEEVVAREGQLYTAPINQLQDVQIEQRGGFWQVSHVPYNPRPSVLHRPNAVVEQINLFDRLVSINGQPFGSLDQLREATQEEPEVSQPPPSPAHSSTGGSALASAFAVASKMTTSVKTGPATSAAAATASPASPVKTCLLQRYPYGWANQIPANERGWIFLERFITAVKCAMLDETQARSILLTDSTEIEDEILSAASRLRGAILEDVEKGVHTCLGKELDTFYKELESKRFSATSTDKLMIDASSGCAVVEDSYVVRRIMKEFTTHLQEHWEAEAAAQRAKVQQPVAWTVAQRARRSLRPALGCLGLGALSRTRL